MTEFTEGLQPEPLPAEEKQITRRALEALTYAALAKMELFVDQQVYPPKTNGLINPFSDLEPSTIVRAIYLPKSDLEREKSRGTLSQEEYDGELRKLNDLEQKLRSNVNKRLKPINDLIFQLIPGKDELVEENGRQRYPETKIEEIFTQPEATYGIRAISFLLDEPVVYQWTVLPDEEFEKFYQMLKQDKLPPPLVSDEEMKRLWRWERAGDIYEWTRMKDLAGQSHPNVSDWERPASVANSSKDADERTPARYAFLDLYQELGNLDQAIEGIGRLYPNEHAPSSA